MSTDRELLELAAKAKPGKRVWGKGDRCAECCNGDRCDDASQRIFCNGRFNDRI